jgi:Putative adhesin
MKPKFALIGLALALCSVAPAQDTPGQRVVVPARNTTRPRKVNVHVLGGSITVKAYSGKDVIVETAGDSTRGRVRRTPVPPPPPGMRRIDLPPTGLSVEEQDNQITVRISPPSHADLVISVPPDTSLDLQALNGSITVEGVKGELTADSMNGKVTMTSVGGNVLAHSQNGSLTVSMTSVDATKPLSFTSMNGTIDVTLPADYKGNVKLSSAHGAIYSDFDFRLGGGTITESNNTPEGKFKVKIDRDRTFSGTINGGGAEATFKTFNGAIYIRKQK